MNIHCPPTVELHQQVKQFLAVLDLMDFFTLQALPLSYALDFNERKYPQ